MINTLTDNLFQEPSHQTSPLEHHQQDLRLPGHRQRPAGHREHVPGGVHGPQPRQTGKIISFNEKSKSFFIVLLL